MNLQAAQTGGTTIEWYDASAGGSFLGSGSPFATPSVSFTTPFYAQPTAIGSPISTQVGGGTTSTTNGPYFPYFRSFEGSHKQYLYTASELTAAGFSAGIFTSMAIPATAISNPGGVYNLDNFGIRMANTAATSMSAFLTPTWTNVYNAASVTPTAPANNVYPFSTNFTWDGVSNVVVDVYYDNDPNNTCSTGTPICSGGSVTETFTTTPLSSCVYFQGNNTTGPRTISTITTVSGSANTRPNFIFTFSTSCIGPRVSVLATINTAPPFTATGSQTVCNNDVATLNVTSNIPDFDSYTWSPITKLYLDPAATSTPYTGGYATTVFARTSTAGSTIYTADATNNTTHCTGLSASTVSNQPTTAITASASQPILCVSGNTTLSITPVANIAANSIQWQSSPTSGSGFTDIPGANSATYAPTVNTTSYFRAEIRNSLGASCLQSNEVLITVNNPAVTGTAPATRCGVGTVTLGATPSAGTSINWYTSAASVTPVGTGNLFIFPVLSITTDYWAAANSGFTSQTSGNGSPVASSGTQNAGVLFDLNIDVTLNSLPVYSTAAGTVTVSILNNALANIYTLTPYPIFASNLSTPQTIPLGVAIPAEQDIAFL